MKNIGKASLPLPSEAPVMILPGTVLFPQALMPLYIFEPRYRAMLQGVLLGERVFCVALIRDGVEEVRDEADFHQTAGLGLVRACVGHEDGTSHLVLQGLARVAFTGFPQRDPFHIAAIKDVEEGRESTGELDGLADQVRELCGKIRLGSPGMGEQLTKQLALVRDAGAVCDFAASAFLRAPAHQQEILEEPLLSGRLRALLRHLHEELG